MNFRIVSCLCVMGAAVAAATAQYTLDWSTVDGGGGTSTGGVYSVTGTIGQPEAGAAMTGGNYSLTGGFWSYLSLVQTPGSPILTIAFTATNTAIISWPSPATGFALQQNTNLNTVDWLAPAQSITDDGTRKYIIVNPPSGNRFYRLIKQ